MVITIWATSLVREALVNARRRANEAAAGLGIIQWRTPLAVRPANLMQTAVHRSIYSAGAKSWR